MDDDAVAGEIVALAREWNTAIVSNDADRIAEFMTDDWVIVSWTGVTGRDDFLGFVRSGTLGHTRMEPASEPRVRVHGDVATLVVRVVSTAQYGGADIDADEWTSDVFVRTDGRWRCALTHITPVGTAT
ncbi:nuclear transport factor 2 family protein [Actinomycetospora chibensis]|uniref:Nuclear transport factor 2 family protein n=1 Tax=Actinomycetospora chibensis TaxID=663606 RepID=A0ABV9RAG3_9PSEU|nr:nuclear transport factor 2 family protein [Actinomycetospora chibensis]MDD7922052.1 nuclear transport factor 2 family protein [Actinomycetospora chibensis]